MKGRDVDVRMAGSAKGKMEPPDQSTGAPPQARKNALPLQAPTRGRQARVLLSVILAAVSLVAALSVLTNRMAARWDMWYYRDMAINGLVGNHRLATPFAYRPVVPLTIFAISRTLHTDPERTFHAATHVVAVILLVLAFYWTRSFGGSELAGWCGMLSLAPNFVMVRYPLFTGTMIDIYAYVLVLIAFWGVLRRRLYAIWMVRHAVPGAELRDGPLPFVHGNHDRYIRVRPCADRVLGRVTPAVLCGPAALRGGAVSQGIHDRPPSGASGRTALGDTSRALADSMAATGTYGFCHRLLHRLDAHDDSRGGKLRPYQPSASRDPAFSDHSPAESETLVQYRLFL